jgi:hypothetical protein
MAKDMSDSIRLTRTATYEHTISGSLDRVLGTLGYSSVMLTKQTNEDVVASVIRSSSDAIAAYARVDHARRDFQKLT